MQGYRRAKTPGKQAGAREMKRKTARGLAAAERIPPAANEEFTAMANGLGAVARPHLAWDPYEVWRTRVKVSSTVMSDTVMPDTVMPERERDSSHSAVQDHVAGVALALP
jgi:hypothetical protein